MSDEDALDVIRHSLETLESMASSSAEELEKVTRERNQYKNLAHLLQEANEKLKRGLLGQKAERLPKDDAQMSLAIIRMALGPREGEDAADTEVELAEQTIPEHTRKKPVRKPLPDHVPRVPIEIIPEEVKREGTEAFDRIGEEKREVIERRPASTVVVQLIYPKFVRKDRQKDAPTSVLVADRVELPIERGTAGPGLLAETIVRRWADHQPINRLEGIYAREGLDLAKTTICTWHDQLRELAEPLVAAMFMDAFASPYLCTDATGVLVQAPERCRNGHFWVLVAPEKHVLFRFSESHDSSAVDKLLAGYAGFLVADAHSVYDHLYRGGTVVEVGCWAHCRRYFFKALDSDPERAKFALARIGALFKIERTVAGAPRKKKEAARLDKSRPIVRDFFDWCVAERDHVLDDSPIAKGIGYALNQRAALARFLTDGRLPLHNNISELNLRREVIGRRNWLFVGSEDGAKANTTFVSLIASCRLHDIEPFGYVRDLLCLLPSWPRHRLLELAPAYFRRTLEQNEAQQKLDANVFRRVSLGLAT
ncbi:MAG TPA: IS66 family transposase [Polyangiaceae bacterium]|nr:IS66 family transposase [Polyangiaceae bacterium]